LTHFLTQVFLTTLNFGIKAVLSACLLLYQKGCARPAVCELTRGALGSVPEGIMSWRQWFTTALPVAIATAGDVSCSNFSLLFVTVSRPRHKE
jgi:hypothetical protein